MGAMSTNFYLYSANDQTSPLNFDEIIDTLNKKIELSYPANKDVYKRTGINENCPSTPGSSQQDLKILKCDPYQIYDASITDNDINKYSQLVHKTLQLVDVATDSRNITW